ARRPVDRCAALVPHRPLRRRARAARHPVHAAPRPGARRRGGSAPLRRMGRCALRAALLPHGGGPRPLSHLESPDASARPEKEAPMTLAPPLAAELAPAIQAALGTVRANIDRFGRT